MSDALERALAFMRELEDQAAERIEPCAHGVALFHDRLPLVRDLNFVRVEPPEVVSPKELADEAERIQSTLRHRRVDVVGEEAARLLEPGFSALGWKTERHVVMIHHRPARRSRDLSLVREVDTETLRAVWTEGIRRDLPHVGEEVVRQLVEHKLVIERAVSVRRFAAVVEDELASFADLYSAGGVGQIEAVLTLERFRNRGLASAVVLKALAESQATGNELTFLVADADDWPQHLYARLGFETVGAYSRFLKEPA